MDKRCLVCKKKIKHDNENLKYCSRECYNKIIWTKNQIGEQNKQWLGEVISKMKLIQLYNNEQRSISSIAKEFNVSNNVIARRLTKYKIKPRSYLEQKKIDSLLGRNIEAHKNEVIQSGSKQNRREYIKKAKEIFPWKCSICNKKKTNKNFDLVVHHKDGNNRNNVSNNLMILCQRHHAKIHREGKKYSEETKLKIKEGLKNYFKMKNENCKNK